MRNRLPERFAEVVAVDSTSPASTLEWFGRSRWQSTIRQTTKRRVNADFSCSLLDLIRCAPGSSRFNQFLNAGYDHEQKLSLLLARVLQQGCLGFLPSLRRGLVPVKGIQRLKTDCGYLGKTLREGNGFLQ